MPEGSAPGHRPRRVTTAARALTLGLVLAAALIPARASAQQLVYVVRHAERADAGMSAAQMNADPPLSEAGRARAEKLAGMLGGSGITAVYATEFARTQQTAAPLAKAVGVTTTILPSSNTAALVAELKAKHAHDIVLIVGHSNTVPAVIRALGGPVVTVKDDEYDKLFVLVPATGVLSTIRY